MSSNQQLETQTTHEKVSEVATESEIPTTKPPSSPSVHELAQTWQRREVEVFEHAGVAAESRPVPEANEGEPSLDQVRIHQARLASNRSNSRLLSDAQLKEQDERYRQRIQRERAVVVKFRYPNLIQVVAKFSSSETVQNLTDFVNETLVEPTEVFCLRFTSLQGRKKIEKSVKGPNTIGELVGLDTRILMDVDLYKTPHHITKDRHLLKKEVLDIARPLNIDKEVAKSSDEVELETQKQTVAKTNRQKDGPPKWLRLPGKK